MLHEILKHIKNYFPVPEKAVEGNFSISNGGIDLSNVLTGQYFLVEGSMLNDGVYVYPATTLKTETFRGRITPLAIPRELITLADEISDYCSKYKETPYVSESFGGYSYTRATNATGNMTTWQNAFGTRLNAWRKI